MRIALSFDDGPGPVTPRLLDLFAARGVRATFFLLGRNLERAPEVAVRMAREGHVLGNHTETHARPDGISPRAFVDEIRSNDERLRTLAARAGVTLPAAIPVRLPYGPLDDDHRLASLASLGRTHTHWTGDFQDWVEPSPDPALLAARVLQHARAQAAAGLDAVIDLHDSSKLYADRSATVDAVDRLLATPGIEWFTVPV
jgi:peptidoglycan/xylan/chitin deacetylase (PgdA/CDA1 family)